MTETGAGATGAAVAWHGLAPAAALERQAVNPADGRTAAAPPPARTAPAS
jgi:hypothetical protein